WRGPLRGRPARFRGRRRPTCSTRYGSAAVAAFYQCCPVDDPARWAGCPAYSREQQLRRLRPQFERIVRDQTNRPRQQLRQFQVVEGGDPDRTAVPVGGSQDPDAHPVVVGEDGVDQVGGEQLGRRLLGRLNRVVAQPDQLLVVPDAGALQGLLVTGDAPRSGPDRRVAADVCNAPAAALDQVADGIARAAVVVQ